MPTYVALLRGIAPMNPNMRNEKLRQVVTDLGFANVTSVISSGNIVFESPRTDVAALQAMLQSAWPAKLGFTSTTILRSQADLERLAARHPFKGYIHGAKTSLNVTFLQHPAPDTAPPSGEGYTIPAIYDREVCSIIDLTTKKTPDFMAKAEKAYGKEITTRSWKTVERILAAMQKTAKQPNATSQK